MIFPFDSLNAHLREVGLIVAVLVGFGFGFVLERAGFGRSPKLAAQFYFYDMTVFKVMFSAIVTAMLGMVLLSQAGLVDLKAVADTATSTTFLWPMIVGGLVLGMGFIIAGYCPGTAIVASASGNIDGMVAFGGVIAGTWIYSEAGPLIGHFHNMSDLGHVYLQDVLKVPAPVVALGVVIMAIGCFIGAEKVEGIFRKKLSLTADPSPRKGAFTFFAACAVLGVVSIPFARTAATATPIAGGISQAELAVRIMEKPWTLRILDLRPASACAASRIPGSECAPLETLATLALPDDTSGLDLVLVSEAGIHEIPSAVRGYSGNVLALREGYAGWKSFALDSPAPESENWRLRSAIHALATGAKQAPPPPPRPVTGGGGVKKKGGGCSS